MPPAALPPANQSPCCLSLPPCRPATCHLLAATCHMPHTACHMPYAAYRLTTAACDQHLRYPSASNCSKPALRRTVRSGDVHQSDQFDLIFKGWPLVSNSSLQIVSLTLTAPASSISYSEGDNLFFFLVQACTDHDARTWQKRDPRVQKRRTCRNTPVYPAHLSIYEPHCDG